MAKLGRKLALLAAAAEAARRYAHKNPDKASKLLDQAAGFVDKQTKGRYSGQIDGFARKAKDIAGVPSTPGRSFAAEQGHPGSAGYSAPGFDTTRPTSPPRSPDVESGQPYPAPPSAPGS